MNPLDLTNCDRELIHQISYVQGHGVFAAVSVRDLRLQHVSMNFSLLFPNVSDPKVIIGQRISEVFPGDFIQIIQNVIKDPLFDRMPPKHFVLRTEKTLDVFVYRMDDTLLGIEIEEIPAEDLRTVKNSESMVRECMIRMKKAATPEELGKIACHTVRLLTGFERVMLYRFFPPTMYGEVVAEDKIAEAKTFNHHRFPSTDIPKPARDLYLKNQIRYIHDSHEETPEVYPKVSSTTGKALDFSNSRLRGVSRIHLEYLKNMDVRGSFSVAVVVDDKLWGLIACHHSRPQYIPHADRERAEIIAQILALTAPILESQIASQKNVVFQEGLHSLFSTLKMTNQPVDHLFREVDRMNSLFDIGGYAIVSSTRMDFGGITPRQEDLMNIWRMIRDWMDQNKKTFFITDSLASFDEKFASIKGLASGVMAFSLSEIDDSIFMVLRPEYLQTILWGGDPRKNFQERNYQGTINPRLSFETWSEVIKNSSKPWEKYQIEGLENFKNLVFDSLMRKDDLINELSEKLKLK